MDLLVRLRQDFPAITFTEGSRFAWHPHTNEVVYRPTARDVQDTWTLLHELGHGLLAHQNFKSDLDLLQMEVAAWDKAEALAKTYEVDIDRDYIEDCLDSYRDWLHARATCPTCYERSLQTSETEYTCHNCHSSWHVTRSRLCRTYRRQGK